MVVIEGVGGQPAFGAELTAVPRFVEQANVHRLRLKQLLDDVAVSIVEFTVETSPSKGGEIAHAVDEDNEDEKN